MGGFLPQTQDGLITEFCPYCRRPLAQYVPDETQIRVLAGKAAMSMTVTMPVEMLEEMLEEPGLHPAVPAPGSARCLYRRCRLRRWWEDRR